MIVIRRLLSCVLLLSLGLIAGCEMFSSDAWQRPSPLSGRPPPPEEKHERQGGFTVLVGNPGQPTAERVVADLGMFASGRGFVRQSAAPPVPSAPTRYVLGDITLDVAYRASDLRVVAALHSFSSRLNRKFVDRFYEDFRQQQAGKYDSESPTFEDEEIDGQDRGSGRSGGRGERGRRGSG